MMVGHAERFRSREDEAVGRGRFGGLWRLESWLAAVFGALWRREGRVVSKRKFLSVIVP